MSRRRPEYTLEPYERVPDDQTVPSPRRGIGGRLAYLGVMVVFAMLLAIGIMLNH